MLKNLVFIIYCCIISFSCLWQEGSKEEYDALLLN